MAGSTLLLSHCYFLFSIIIVFLFLFCFVEKLLGYLVTGEWCSLFVFSFLQRKTKEIAQRAWSSANGEAKNGGNKKLGAFILVFFFFFLFLKLNNLISSCRSWNSATVRIPISI